MSVYISSVAEGATPGIGHWLEIRDSLYMTTRRFTLAQQPGQSLDIQVNKKFHKFERVYRDCIKRTRDKTRIHCTPHDAPGT